MKFDILDSPAPQVALPELSSPARHWKSENEVYGQDVPMYSSVSVAEGLVPHVETVMTAPGQMYCPISSWTTASVATLFWKPPQDIELALT